MSDIPILHKEEPQKEDELIKVVPAISEQIGFLTESIKDAQEVTGKASKLMADTFLGDVSFITRPIQEIKEIGTKFGGLFKRKVQPKKSSLLKDKTIEGASAVYLGNIIEESKEDKESFLDKFKGIMPMLIGGAGGAGISAALSGVMPKLMKAAPIAAIGAGIIWMAIDGIRGAMKAKEWGTTKISGAIGGMMGGMDKGVKGAFKNMGKWALIGAGIGSIVPVVGTIVGGLIGAAIGGILGFIGGERIAKASDAVGSWFKDAWGNILDFFKKSFIAIKDFGIKLWNSPIVQKTISFLGNVIDIVFDAIKTPFIKVYDGIMDSINKVKEIFGSDESIGKKVGKLLVEVVTFVPKIIFNWYTGIWNGMKKLFEGIFISKKEPDGTIKKSLMKQFWELVTFSFSALGGKIKDLFVSMIHGVSSISSSIKDGIINAINAIPSLLIKGIESTFTFLSDMWSGIKESLSTIPVVGDIFGFLDEYIFAPIGNIFTSIKDGIITFIKNPLDFGKKIIEDLIDSVLDIFGKLKEGFLNFFTGRVESDKDYIIDAKKRTSSFTTGIPGLGGISGGNPISTNVQDAIIKPDGSIIRTDTNDTLIATKNPVGFADKEVNNSIQSNMDNKVMEKVLMILEQLSKTKEPSNQNNIMTNNYVSRYNPVSIMNNLSAEVF